MDYRCKLNSVSRHTLSVLHEYIIQYSNNDGIINQAVDDRQNLSLGLKSKFSPLVT